MTGITAAIASGGVVYTGSATVTVGNASYFPSGSVFVDRWGFSTGLEGSVTPATWAGTNSSIISLDYVLVYISSPVTSFFYSIVFQVTGYAPNAGWTTMTVDTTPLSRASAAYNYDGTNTVWQWDATSIGNPFGYTVGATKAVTWS